MILKGVVKQCGSIHHGGRISSAENRRWLAFPANQSLLDWSFGRLEAISGIAQRTCFYFCLCLDPPTSTNRFGGRCAKYTAALLVVWVTFFRPGSACLRRTIGHIHHYWRVSTKGPPWSHRVLSGQRLPFSDTESSCCSWKDTKVHFILNIFAMPCYHLGNDTYCLCQGPPLIVNM